MRKMIAVAAMIAVSSAHAAEQLKFGDVNYFLKEGEKNVAVDFSSTYAKTTNLGTRLETRGYITDVTAAYAFSDKLNAFLSLGYAYDRETEDETTPTNADFSSDGLATPGVGVNYRFMSQSETAYNIDFGAVARINVEDAETGTAGEDGNFASSRDSLELNARMGRKWNEANEWQLAAGVVYSLDGEYTQNGAGADVDIEEDSSIDAFLRATYQYRPVNEFMILLSAQATQFGEMDGEVEPNTKTKQDSHLDLDFRFTAKYLITENFIGKFNYGMSRNAEINREVGGANSDLERRRENFFGLGVDFLF